LRALIKKPRLLGKPGLPTKPNTAVALILRILFFLFAGIFAITQESSDGSVLDSSVRGDSHPGDVLLDDMLSDFQDGEEEPPPGWMPPGPPRWFRSNAGGMTLEEVPSRLAALRNKYALVIDYIAPDEIEPRLLPFYQDGYTVEIRVLYEDREESRRQWLFRDKAGATRLNAVFKRQPDEAPGDLSADTQLEAEEAALHEEIIEEKIIENKIIENEIVENKIIEKSSEPVELAAATLSPEESPPDEFSGDAMPDPESSAALVSNEESPVSTGFIELYNEKAQIIEDRWFFEDDSEMVISYFYNRNTLIKTETGKKIPSPKGDAAPKGDADSPPDVEPEQYPEAVYRPMYTDTYRYNRSFSLRYVERLYHQKVELEPVRLVFPGRVLDAAADQSFMRDKLALGSDFLENFSVEEGGRIIYDTDSRGRIITQTMIDGKNETVWVIKNTWSGDRIIAMNKIEGENEKRIEYEYDKDGNQIVQRDKIGRAHV
jgi:hypothetical protein